eukprot:jgi/Bigna1/82539/fgenesh1_pg.93_\
MRVCVCVFLCVSFIKPCLLLLGPSLLFLALAMRATRKLIDAWTPNNTAEDTTFHTAIIRSCHYVLSQRVVQQPKVHVSCRRMRSREPSLTLDALLMVDHKVQIDGEDVGGDKNAHRRQRSEIDLLIGRGESPSLRQPMMIGTCDNERKHY